MATLEAKLRLKLAIAAILQVLSMIMLVFSPVMLFIMLPFATTGFIVVVFVIYCGFKKGLYYSLAVSSFLLVLNVVPFVQLLMNYEEWGMHWSRLIIYAVSVAINLWAIYAALRLMRIREPEMVPEVKEESAGFFKKIQNKASQSIRSQSRSSKI